MAKLTKKENIEINRLRGLFPGVISVNVERSQDGGFFAEVKNFPGCFTEANTFSELIEMVNDAVKTYFDVPDKYLSFMPNYMPPLKQAQRLDAFPVVEKASELKLEIFHREKVAR